MSAVQPARPTTVVHHHHYYGHASSPATLRRAPNLPHRTSPAVLIGAGASIAVVLVVATAVATVLAVVGGLVLLLVLAGRHYIQIERDHRVMARPSVRRDARGRFVA